MSRNWSVPLAALVFALLPLRASAAVATVSIGTFEWSQFFFSDDFRLENISSAAGLSADFTDVSLIVTTDYDGDGIPDVAAVDAFPPGGFSTTLAPTVPDNSFLSSLDSPVLSALLSFRFAPVGLPELVFSQTFATPDVIFIDYSYEVPEPEPSPVPEPATLILLSVGLGAALLAKRK